jgi:hypothetical protein
VYHESSHRPGPKDLRSLIASQARIGSKDHSFFFSVEKQGRSTTAVRVVRRKRFFGSRLVGVLTHNVFSVGPRLKGIFMSFDTSQEP